MSVRWAWSIKLLSQFAFTVLAVYLWAPKLGGSGAEPVLQRVGTLIRSVWYLPLIVLAVLLAGLLVSQTNPRLEPPEPSRWLRLVIELSGWLNWLASSWLLVLMARTLDVGELIWQCIVPLYVSGVMFVNVFLGPHQQQVLTWWQRLALILVRGFTLKPSPWSGNADVFREARAFNRGLHASAGMLLGVCGLLQIGLWPSIGTTLFVHLASTLHAFLSYRRVVPLPAAAAPGQSASSI